MTNFISLNWLNIGLFSVGETTEQEEEYWYFSQWNTIFSRLMTK